MSIWMNSIKKNEKTLENYELTRLEKRIDELEKSGFTSKEAFVLATGIGYGELEGTKEVKKSTKNSYGIEKETNGYLDWE